jgi:hypothetical protein
MYWKWYVSRTAVIFIKLSYSAGPSVSISVFKRILSNDMPCEMGTTILPISYIKAFKFTCSNFFKVSSS